MRCTLCVATSQTSNSCGHKKGPSEDRGRVILGGHVNPQYDYGFGRILIKHHLPGKARLILILPNRSDVLPG